MIGSFPNDPVFPEKIVNVLEMASFTSKLRLADTAYTFPKIEKLSERKEGEAETPEGPRPATGCLCTPHRMLSWWESSKPLRL